MRKIRLIVSAMFIVFGVNGILFAETITGKIDKFDSFGQNKIIDYSSQKPIDNAKISIPDLNYVTYSSSDGTFKLNVDINDKTVLFVEKEGYKVFSLTIDNTVLNNPLKLGIEKSTPFDMQLSSDVIHLGDNMFSSNSANSSEFKLYASGHVFGKTFLKPYCRQNQEIIIKIGTVIGLDTKRAREARQNNISKVYSSPAEVYINGRRIASLELNGDNIEIIIPKNIIKEQNELKIITGRNLFQTEYIDYDDIELANIRIETKENSQIARKQFLQKIN